VGGGQGEKATASEARLYSEEVIVLCRLGVLTSNSPNLLASAQPPCHALFIRLTATNRFPTQSCRAPAPHCIADRTRQGESAEFQSHSQTVPKEPSPTHLIVL
jgi:hypothetical protein